MLALSACSDPDFDTPAEPVVAAIDSPDTELAEFLKELIGQARVMPKSGAMRGRLAMAYEVNGFPDAALAAYEQAESLDPSDFRWPYFRALLLAQEGDHEGALVGLERAIAIDADYAPALLWRGTWLLESNRLEEAALAFERAGDLGVDADASFGRAQVLIAQGRHAEAVALLEPYARESRHPHVFRTLGQALRATGRIEEARLAMARARDAIPFSWRDQRRDQLGAYLRGNASFEVAQELSDAGRNAEALKILERLAERNPEEQCGRPINFFFTCSLLNALSIAYAHAGRAEEAIELAKRAIELNPDFAPFHLSIASRYREQGDHEDALRHADRAIELNSVLADAYWEKGRLLFDLGKRVQAREALLTALRYEPQRLTTLLYLGMIEAELQDWPHAIERFERLVVLDPNYERGHLYLARSLGEGGRIEAAWQALRMAQRRRADASEVDATERRLRELEEAR